MKLNKIDVLWNSAYSLFKWISVCSQKILLPWQLDVTTSITSTPKPYDTFNKEEKSLRHVAKVAKFLDDNKPKRHLKKWIRTVSNFIDLI